MTVKTAVPKPKASTKTSEGKKKPATKANHPPTAEMVNAALAALKDKKGSSLQAIKKYIAGIYLIDAEKQAIYIRKYLKSAVEKKTIVQTKGVGAAGRFKLGGKSDGVQISAASKKSTAKTTADEKPVKEGASKKAAKKPVAKKTPTKQPSTSKVTKEAKSKKTAKTASKPVKKAAVSKGKSARK